MLKILLSLRVTVDWSYRDSEGFWPNCKDSGSTVAVDGGMLSRNTAIFEPYELYVRHLWDYEGNGLVHIISSVIHT